MADGDDTLKKIVRQHIPLVVTRKTFPSSQLAGPSHAVTRNRFAFRNASTATNGAETASVTDDCKSPRRTYGPSFKRPRLPIVPSMTRKRLRTPASDESNGFAASDTHSATAFGNSSTLTAANGASSSKPKTSLGKAAMFWATGANGGVGSSGASANGASASSMSFAKDQSTLTGTVAKTTGVYGNGLDYSSTVEPPPVVRQLCGRHLETIRQLTKISKKSFEKATIRIRSDIFDDCESADEQQRKQYDAVTTQLLNVHGSSLLRVLKAANSIRDQPGFDLQKELNSSLLNCNGLAAMLSHLLMRVHSSSQSGTEVPSNEKRELVLEFPAACEYMGIIIDCIELETRNAEWKTAIMMTKERVGRILRHSKLWGNEAFLLNFSKRIDPNKSSFYLQAADYVNSLPISEKFIQHALRDHTIVGSKTFMKYLQTLSKPPAESKVILKQERHPKECKEVSVQTDNVDRTFADASTQPEKSMISQGPAAIFKKCRGRDPTKVFEFVDGQRKEPPAPLSLTAEGVGGNPSSPQAHRQ